MVYFGEYETMTRKKPRDYPKIDFVLPRLNLVKSSFNILVGTGNSAKSMMAQHIGLCYVTGKPFLGKFDMEITGKVLHLDQEMSKNQTFLRYERMATAIEYEAELGIVRAKLVKHYDGSTTSLIAIKQELVEAIKTNRTGLVIIDSLSRLHTLDENSTDLVPLLEMLKNVSEETTVCIILIHHKGKGKDAKQSGRGSSSIYDSADTQIDLFRAPFSKVTDVWSGKNRDYADFDGLAFTLRDDGEWLKDQHCSEKLFLDLTEQSKNRPEEKQMAMFSRLLQTDLSQNKLTEKTDMTKQTAVSLANDWVDKGFAATIKDGKSLIYSLTNEGYKKFGYDSKEAFHAEE